MAVVSPDDGIVREGVRTFAADMGIAIATLDRAGFIVAVNEDWELFCAANGGDPARTGVGESYLSVCDAAGDLASDQVATAIRQAAAGVLPGPVTVPIDCDAPGRPRQFDVLISPRQDDGGKCVGVTLTLSLTQSSAAGLDRPIRSGTRSGTTQPGLPVQREPSSTPARSSQPDLTFPDAPRLALDELIGQLTDRAQDVLTAQGRLRALLRANAAITGELSLPVVLRHVVIAAQELVHARYGALGVIGPNGRLEQFVHVGMDAAMAAHIGDLPSGEGILGLLIHHPEPVRLPDLRVHPAAAGFPDRHPTMASFLGVPIRVRGQVFGNLYLTDSTNGQFSSEDEQLVTALANTAGIAIANARLHQETVQQRRWLDASAEFTQTLLAHTAEPPLDVLLRFAVLAASADMATYTTPLDERTARVDAATGALAGRAGDIISLDHTLVGRVIRSGKPVLVGDHADEFGPDDMTDLPDGVGAAIGVPLLGPGQVVLGALLVAHAHNRAHFTTNDRDHLNGFAGHVGIALELERSREEHETLLQMDDHDRIAADLHDHVIQELFAIGMGLQSMLNRLSRPDHRARISSYIETLDATIRRIRDTIYQLHSDAPEPEAPLSRRLLAVLTDQTADTELAVTTELTGHLDALPSDVHDDVTAVLRELLSNTVRHAGASTISVRIALSGNVLTLEVTDNGVGMGHPTRSSGLANLRRRAAAHSGVLHHDIPPGGGTHVRWTAVTGARQPAT